MGEPRLKRPRIFDDSDSASEEASAVSRGGSSTSIAHQTLHHVVASGPDHAHDAAETRVSSIASTAAVANAHHGDGTSLSIAPQSVTSERDWTEFIQASSKPYREPLGSQLRELLVTTAFSGLGSIMEVLRKLGIAARELAAAEIKPSAHTFCKRNSLLAEHHFEDVRSLVAHGSGKCIKHGHCKMPTEKADLSVMGFPCQPYSGARPGSHDPDNVTEHVSFQYAQEAIRYIKKTRPRAALLENVLKFAENHRGTSRSFESQDNVVNFCENFCEELRKLGYHVCWTRLDLNSWVEANSTRIYIFVVDRDVGPESTVVRASELAQEMQVSRSQYPAMTLASYCLRAGCPEWSRECMRLLQDDFDPASSGRMGDADASWKKQAAMLRGRHGWQGKPWTQPGEQPPRLRGYSRTARSEEITDLGFFWGAKRLGLDPHSADHRPLIARQLLCDPTQNPGRNPWSMHLRRLTRGCRPYIYSQDRCMFPLEAFRAYGWDNPCLHGLTDDEAWDLLGDSMALQTLGVAVSALLWALGERLPGLWQGRRPT